MNKNSLSQLNKLYVERCRQLVVQNQELQLKNEALEKAINERNEIIDNLLKNLESKNSSFVDQEFFSEPTNNPIEEPQVVEEPQKEKVPEIVFEKTDIEVPELPELDSVGEYAAKAISKMVISSAKHSNIITSSSYDNKKDLLNLIIGKCENAKYEISDILHGQCTDAQKVQMIDACVNDAIEYFGCVIEQK